MQINEKVIEEIKLRADIVEIISAYVELKRAGRNHMGLCPFHQEKTPSFNVSGERQIFKCFGCNASGDVIAFIMKYEGLNFVEAVKKLADKYGITIEEGQNLSYQQKRNILYYNINQEAADFFSSILNNDSSKRYLSYLMDRGINENSIKEFHLGAAFDKWDSLITHLKNKGFSEQAMDECGLISFTRNDHKAIDRFRSRIIFPVYNATGKISGFSGRIVFKEDEQAKYLNTPETAVFKKSQLLYGMHQARRHINTKRRAILVEGHLDVIAMHQHGFQETLGVQGTSFTEEHAAWLKKQADEIIIMFDADNAGVKAALRMLPIILRSSLITKVAVLPPEEDPASLLQSGHSSKITEFIEQAKPLLEFKIDRLKRSAASPEQLRNLLIEILKDISNVTSPVLRDSLLQNISKNFSLRHESVMEEWKNLNHRPANPLKRFASEDNKPQNNINRAEEELLTIVLADNDLCKPLFNRLEFDWLTSKTSYSVFEKILRCFCEKSFRVESYDFCLQELNNKDSILKKSLSLPKSEDTVNLLNEVLDHIEKEFLRNKVKKLTDHLNSMDQDKQLKAITEIDHINKRIRELTPNPMKPVY